MGRLTPNASDKQRLTLRRSPNEGRVGEILQEQSDKLGLILPESARLKLSPGA